MEGELSVGAPKADLSPLVAHEQKLTRGLIHAVTYLQQATPQKRAEAFAIFLTEDKLPTPEESAGFDGRFALGQITDTEAVQCIAGIRRPVDVHPARPRNMQTDQARAIQHVIQSSPDSDGRTDKLIGYCLTRAAGFNHPPALDAQLITDFASQTDVRAFDQQTDAAIAAIPPERQRAYREAKDLLARRTYGKQWEYWQAWKHLRDETRRKIDQKKTLSATPTSRP